MTKILLITDLHFGRHSDSPEILKYQEIFFNEIFFPFLKENKINQIISLGDEFESRKNVNYNTLYKAKEMFFDRIEHEGCSLTVIIGNHNTFYKEHNDVNSSSLLFDKHPNIKIIEKPEEISYGDCKFLLIPWINKNNQEEIIKSIKSTTAKYLLGHFEVVGLSLHENWQFHKGLDHNLLDKFDQIWSGHYHLKMKKDNFTYLGTPYQLDWSDVNHKKGFYVFDTENKKTTFIENKHKIYHYIEYNDDVDINSFDYMKYKDSYIRIVLNNSIKEFDKFDLFIKKFDEICYDLKVNEKFFQTLTVSNETQPELSVESTINIIKRRCDEIDIVDKEKLFKFMNNAFLKSKDLMTV